MFTGLIEEIGTIKNIKNLGGGIELSIYSQIITKDLTIGDSININGACQTVIEFGNDFFRVEAVEETLKKTSLGTFKHGEKVNLERSLTLNKKMGGHFVMGHVDTSGEIIKINKLATSYIVEIAYPKEFSELLINVGAIAVDGVSLTIAEFNDRSFSVSIIPHTWGSTVFQYKKSGSVVNLEFDILGKYVARMLNKKPASAITEEWLKQNGF